MKILVPVKRVVDHSIRVRPKTDGSDVDTEALKKSINPFCEIAVEEAVRIKEAGLADEVVVVSVGTPKAEEQLRTALATGADRAILVVTAPQPLEPLAVAKCLSAIIDIEQPDLVILGKQSIDGDNNQTGQMLAALRSWPQATFASKVELENRKVRVTREVDGGLETLELTLPAVITADLRLNEPRYLAMPRIAKARQKPLQTMTVEQLGINMTPRTRVVSVGAPPERAAGVIVASVKELVTRLKSETEVL